MIKGLYVHIPFCKKICVYCDFVKLVAKPSLQEEYMASLEKELKSHRKDLLSVETVYLGGGTPSSLNLDLFESFLKSLSQTIDFSTVKELTVEANPGDVNDEWIELMKRYKVNRISLGVQSFSDSLLKSIGRTHTSKEAIRAVNKLISDGFFSVSIDLIYALPNQTLSELKQDLDTALSLGIHHLSVYSLILEEKTELYFLVQKGNIVLPSEEEEEQMALWIRERLAETEFIHYEISNYGLKGHFSCHNLIYWNLDEYLGIGLGAASQYGNHRFVNYRTLRKYIDQVNLTSDGIESIEPFDEMQETILLGLRKADGISKSGFLAKFHKTPYEAYPGLEKHLNHGLLLDDGDRIHLTEEGFLLSNQVLIELF